MHASVPCVAANSGVCGILLGILVLNIAGKTKYVTCSVMQNSNKIKIPKKVKIVASLARIIHVFFCK
jgi:hypothetical protein